MKAFNKLFSLVVASVLVFSLAGCGDKEGDDANLLI